MAQNITLTIAGKEFHLKAETPENEKLMRMAASNVNKAVDRYSQMYPDRSLEDRLIFIALSQAASVLSQQKKNQKLESGIQELDSELSAYLSKIEQI